MTDPRIVRRYLGVALLLAYPALAVSPDHVAAAPALALDDIVAMLEAGIGETVILKQIELSGTRLILTVEGLIRLKKAGASDELLEALVAPEERGPEPDPIPLPADVMHADAGHDSFRVYAEVDDNGEQVVHITNLDESGQRIGGEVERPAYPNVVRPSEDPPRPEEDRYDQRGSYRDDTGDRGQVVVNVYPQDSGSTEAARDPYERDYRDRYGRYSRVYYGRGRSDHHFHTPTCGHLFYYYQRHFPYGHGHRAIRHGHHSRPRHGLGVPFLGSIRTVPYSHSSAAVRNQRIFGRR